MLKQAIVSWLELGEPWKQKQEWGNRITLGIDFSGCMDKQKFSCALLPQPSSVMKGKAAQGKGGTSLRCYECIGGQKDGEFSVWVEKKVRTFGIRQDMLLKRDLICFVRWPHYIQLQWQTVGSLLFLRSVGGWGVVNMTLIQFHWMQISAVRTVWSRANDLEFWGYF